MYRDEVTSPLPDLHKAILYVSIVMLALALVGCAQVSPTPAQASTAPLTVTLHAFSGRPDPSWQVTQPQEIQAITTRLENLPVAADPAWTDPLGYRGMGLARTAQNGWERVRVWRGVVALTQHERTTYYQDTAGLEALLQAQARAQGWGAVLP